MGPTKGPNGFSTFLNQIRGIWTLPVNGFNLFYKSDALDEARTDT